MEGMKAKCEPYYAGEARGLERKLGTSRDGEDNWGIKVRTD